MFLMANRYRTRAIPTSFFVIDVTRLLFWLNSLSAVQTHTHIHFVENAILFAFVCSYDLGRKNICFSTIYSPWHRDEPIEMLSFSEVSLFKRESFVRKAIATGIYWTIIARFPENGPPPFDRPLNFHLKSIIFSIDNMALGDSVYIFPIVIHVDRCSLVDSRATLSNDALRVSITYTTTICT